MKKIKSLKYWPLKNVLTEKYRLRPLEARALADFLLKMLKWVPAERATAQEMLNHYWFKMVPQYDTKMSKREMKEFKQLYNIQGDDDEDSGSDDNES